MPDLGNILNIMHWEDDWGNSVLDWLVVVVVTLLLWLVLRLVKGSLAKRAGALAKKRRAGEWFRAVERLLQQTKTWCLFILALYLALYCGSLLQLPAHILQIVTAVTVVTLLVQAALWANAMLGFSISHYVEQHREVDPAGVTTLSALGFLGKLVIWAVAGLSAVASLGIDVTAMVAGLGIGGIAVALAAQNILGDLFASVSIVLDKPFILGDFIVVDDKMGNVEHIGLKTTHLRSLTGEQLVFSNTDLLKSRIHNYKRMAERRVLFTIGIAYETPYEKVAAVPAVLRAIIESQKPTRFDRAHFARYGDSALIFEVVYYVLAADYATYMDVQQAVNLAIFRRFEDDRIEFAYPTQTIHLRQQSEPA